MPPVFSTETETTTGNGDCCCPPPEGGSSGSSSGPPFPEVVYPCCFCTVFPRKWHVVVDGVTDATCTTCAGYNRDWELTLALPDQIGVGGALCGWNSKDTPGICTPTSGAGTVHLYCVNGPPDHVVASYGPTAYTRVWRLNFAGVGGVSDNADYWCYVENFKCLGTSKFLMDPLQIGQPNVAGCGGWPDFLFVSPLA